MLDKSEFYHGAAIARLLEHRKCMSVRRHGQLGYVVNETMFVFIKFSTRANSPWQFTFDAEDVARSFNLAREFGTLAVALVCGGDGVCALSFPEIWKLLQDKAGSIGVRRKHNESYAVRGTAGELKRKIPLNRWPLIVFDLETDNRPELEVISRAS